MDGFATLVQEFGAPHRNAHVSVEEAERYRECVPSALRDFWTQYGRGCFDNGQNWICDPEPFKPVLKAVFKNDKEFDVEDLTVIQRSSFARLTAWSRRRAGHVTIDFNFGEVTTVTPNAWINEDSGKRYSDDEIVGALIYGEKYSEGFVDENSGDDLFPAALARYGALDPDEVYGFFPALQIGGKGLIGDIRRVKIIPHLLFLAELENFKLMKMSSSDPDMIGELVPVRTIVR